jgi:FixJ family two-component response regulator
VSPLVHIVDDDDDFRAGIARLLRLHGYAVAEYPSANDFLERVRSDAEVGCILLDVGLPGLSGPELQARLTEIGSLFPIVFLTGHGDVSTTVRAIKAGAEDFLTKPVPQQALLDSIGRAFARYKVERTRQDWMKAARSLLDSLTPREREVFEFVVRGRMNKQTARALGITERTIKAHRQRIFDKLGAQTIGDLVLLAERLGILHDSPGADTPQASKSLAPDRSRQSH